MSIHWEMLRVITYIAEIENTDTTTKRSTKGEQKKNEKKKYK